ncbi:MAG: YitT family protein [Lachnospiraceae bacterium]|nr:YitT family protein [Lachnospiraceae bacterium]
MNRKFSRLFSNMLSYTVVILLALLLAVNYHIFIVENHFAPAGLNGIATMVQYKTGFSISYMSLLINLPLCALAYFFVEKEYSVKTLVFTLVYSFSYLFLQGLELDFLQYNAEGHDTIFPAIISGVITGFVSGVCLKNSASTGGMDLISKYINKRNPGANFFMVTFVLNAVIACISLFVYSDAGVLNYKPVALCITYCFVSNFVGNQIIKGAKTAYKFTIITTHPDEICLEITNILRHGATRLEARGAYTGTSKSVLLCVVNKHQLTDFKKIIDRYDETFSFYEVVNETYGNFKYVRT